MQSKVLYDVHTHTVYSHGKGTIMDNARAAHEAGLRVLGIADHGPGHMSYAVDMKKIPQMRADIDEAMKAFPGLDIKLGVEANIVNYSGKLDVTDEMKKEFDYIIAGYHYGYFGENFFHGLITCISGWLYSHGFPASKGRRQKNTELIIAALMENDIKLLTHPGDKMPVDIEAIAKVCAMRGTLMEINTHHAHLNEEEIKLASKYDVTFILSSDAHRPENVGNVEEALARAKASGIDLSRIANYRG